MPKELAVCVLYCYELPFAVPLLKHPERVVWRGSAWPRLVWRLMSKSNSFAVAGEPPEREDGWDGRMGEGQGPYVHVMELPMGCCAATICSPS
jgi:hypothetical protein